MAPVSTAAPAVMVPVATAAAAAVLPPCGIAMGMLEKGAGGPGKGEQ